MQSHQYDVARRWLKTIQSEYEDSAAAKTAALELAKIPAAAVAYYRQSGDADFQPASHPGQPQIAAREKFEKMYREANLLEGDAKAGQADYAFYYWSRALATEGKVAQAIQQLSQFPQKFPDSKLKPKAQYSLGFLLGSQKKYPQVIKELQKVLELYPNERDLVSESLWHLAFFNAWSGDYKAGLPYLEKLGDAAYKDSPRAPYVARWIGKFKERMK